MLIASGEVGAMRSPEQVAVLGLSAEHVGAAGDDAGVSCWQSAAQQRPALPGRSADSG